MVHESILIIHMEEGTVFEKRSFADGPKKLIIPALILCIFAMIFFAWSRISTGGHHALQEARDVRVAMKLASLEYFSADGSIYDSRNPDGMASGAADKIRSLSYAEGDIKLLAWDRTNNLPKSFTYRKGPYLIEFNALNDSSSVTGEWDVYYAFHVMHYSTGTD